MVKNIIYRLIAAACVWMIFDMLLPDKSVGRTAKRLIAFAQTVIVLEPIIELLR